MFVPQNEQCTSFIRNVPAEFSHRLLEALEWAWLSRQLFPPSIYLGSSLTPDLPKCA